LRRFTLASLLATVGIGSVFGWAGSRVAVDYALHSRTQAIAVQVSEFMAPRLVPEDFAGRNRARRVQFEFATRDLLGKAGILHVRVWNSKGDLLYSRGDPPATPRTPPPEVERALIGEISSRHLEGQAAGPPHRLQVSIPIRLSKTGTLVGAYQVVADITDLNNAIRSLTLTVWKSIILGILVLYLALFTIVRRASEDLVRQQEQLRQGFIGTIESLVRAVDARDVATADHSSRVAQYAEAIARTLRLGEAAIQQVKAAAFLHDVGKIGIRDDILATETTLTAGQWELVRRHPVTGYEILQPVPIPEAIRLGVLHSHEAWDGGGYPHGLVGDAIPLAARIIAVADTYEVLTKGRPYKAARSHADALREIAARSGTQFDPQVVEALHRARDAAIVTPASSAAGHATRAHLPMLEPDAVVPSGSPADPGR
jgi:hypothetical protein